MLKSLLELINASLMEGSLPSTLKKTQQLNQFTKKGRMKTQAITVQLLLSQLFQRFWKK
jgi:hypothetical protein